ncbi:MAG TPA: hypothetical protein DD435_00260 [Cyanobacteria bacterium UBA8530]|nr:hypothetical protein [Cyanobacteria bacterium UBA8530]
MKKLRCSATILALFLLAGCGGNVPLVLEENQAKTQSSGLFGPKMPKDRPLAAEEKKGGFDAYFVLAQKESLKWSKDAVLVGAEAQNVDEKGEKAGGTKYDYSFTSGKHGLTISIAGNNLAFEEKPVDPKALKIGAFIPAPQAIAAAKTTDQLKAATFVLALAHPSDSPTTVFLVAELKKNPVRVLLNAENGAVIKVTKENPDEK